jgi:predicted Holliday junction resolvase-like endonuclease
MNQLTLALTALTMILLFMLIVALWRCRILERRLDSLDFQNRSLSTTYGQITEQWFPLMDAYPYDPQQFRFLGSPIDGVQFEEDRIVFVEFKTNRARLSKRQQRLRELIEAGEVYWEEFRFTAENTGV